VSLPFFNEMAVSLQGGGLCAPSSSQGHGAAAGLAVEAAGSGSGEWVLGLRWRCIRAMTPHRSAWPVAVVLGGAPSNQPSGFHSLSSRTASSPCVQPATDLLNPLSFRCRCVDVNGDGSRDLVIGSPMARNTNDTSDPFTSERGRVDVFVATPARGQAKAPSSPQQNSGVTGLSALRAAKGGAQPMKMDAGRSPAAGAAPALLWLEDDADWGGAGETVGAWFGSSVDVVPAVSFSAADLLRPYLSAVRTNALSTNTQHLANPYAHSAVPSKSSADATAAAVKALAAAFPACEEALQQLLAAEQAAGVDGQLLDAGDAGIAASLLLVGAPGTRGSVSQSPVGRVYAYAVASSTATARDAATLQAAAVSVQRCLSAQGSEGAPARAAQPLPAPLFTVTGAQAIDSTSATATSKLGAALAVGFPLTPASQGVGAGAVLAVSMPDSQMDSLIAPATDSNTSWSTAAGAVLLWPLGNTSAALPAGDVSISALTAAPLPGNRYGVRALLAASSVGTAPSGAGNSSDDLAEARFGYTLGWTDVNGDGYDDLVVGAPMYSANFVMAPAPPPSQLAPVRAGAGGSGSISLDTGRQVGSVLVYKGGPGGTPLGVVPNAEGSAAWRTNGRVQWGRIGYTAAAASSSSAGGAGTRLGCGGGGALALVDWDGDGSQELVAGALRASEALPAAAALPDAMNGEEERANGPWGADGSAEMPGAVYVFAQPAF